jgi:glycine oxidase
MLAPVTEAHFGEEELLALNLESSARYPAFVQELEASSDMSCGYDSEGTLQVARDADEDAVLERLLQFQLELGLEVHRLRPRKCRELEPALSPRIRGGIYVPGDHRIDGRALTEALVIACERAGVRFARAKVASIAVTAGRARGVALSDGRVLASDDVVLSAGCWSGSIEGLPPEARPPVRPVKGQVLVLRGSAQEPLIRRSVRGVGVYAVPRRDGRVVVGATVEERGFDVTVTAGAAHDLLRAAYELVPGVTELELIGVFAGLRPGSPDNAPLLGRSGLDGLVIATGHYRNGILLTPVTADAIAALLATGEIDELIAPFAPARFARHEAFSS